MRRILRHEVRVDGEVCRIPAPPLHVEWRPGDREDVVQVWTEDVVNGSMEVVVVGTGQPWPDDDWQYAGTATVLGGVLVWHVLARPAR